MTLKRCFWIRIAIFSFVALFLFSLQDLLSGREQRLLAASNFARQQQSLEELMRNLQSPDATVRAKAAHLLAKFRSGAAPAIPRLIELLADDTPVDPREIQSWTWRWSGIDCQLQPTSPGMEAADALSHIGSAAVEPLFTLLMDEDTDVRQAALFALVEFVDERAIPGLVTALSDGNAKYAAMQQGC